MARRPPLPEQLRERARSSLHSIVYLSDQGKRLVRLLPSDAEPGEFYLRRVSSLRREQGVGTDVLGSLPRLDPQIRRQDAVEEIKTSVLHNLDLLADSFISLGEQFLAAAEDADPERLEALAAQGAPVNYHDPRNGLTALHYVAAQGARRAFRALLRIGGLDFLARDDRGRLASEMAGAFGQNLAMERLLFRKEIQQARENGIPLEELYRRDAAPRSTVPPNP
jgi:Ankyrin repeats (many copies)